MIKNIFLDIDETLIHSEYRKFNEEIRNDEITLSFSDSPDLYTYVRPCAAKVIDAARALVGHENVYILTTSIREYAEQVNEGAGWDFKNQSIFTREDLRAALKNGIITPHHTLTDSNNVIVDNLPPRYNLTKMAYIGIDTDQYLQVRDYYGTTDDETESAFYKQVVNFLQQKYQEN
jgi:FMN phosphatase YigB (HAD superfamily)